MAYSEDKYLPLSGLQHFCFCPRQWALIHVEGLWAENVRTVDGKLLHGAAHDPTYTETRGDRRIVRAVRVFSPTLGVSGECDVVEYIRSSDGARLPGRQGLWQPFPVEYKRGEQGAHTQADAMQLCAQGMGLEEMHCCAVPEGALYYGLSRRRTRILFTPELRTQVREALAQMHTYMARGYTPRVKPSKSCQACSLKELCLPKLLRTRSVSAYLRARMEDAE